MPVTIERLPDKSIILVTYHGRIVLDDVKLLFQRSAELMEDMAGHVYRLNDLRDITADFSEVIEMVKVGTHDLPGTSSDPRLTSVFVGRSAMARLYADLMRHRTGGEVYIPIVDTMEDAMTLIENDIYQRETLGKSLSERKRRGGAQA